MLSFLYTVLPSHFFIKTYRFMYKYLLSVFFLMALNISQSHAQNSTVTKSGQEYYINITGVNSRQDVLNIQEFIAKKPGVSFFMARKYPVMYFVLRTQNPISKETFSGWLNSTSFKIEHFGEGETGLEKATLIGKKQRKIQQN